MIRIHASEEKTERHVEKTPGAEALELPGEPNQNSVSRFKEGKTMKTTRQQKRADAGYVGNHILYPSGSGDSLGEF